MITNLRALGALTLLFIALTSGLTAEPLTNKARTFSVTNSVGWQVSAPGNDGLVFSKAGQSGITAVLTIASVSGNFPTASMRGQTVRKFSKELSGGREVRLDPKELHETFLGVDAYRWTMSTVSAQNKLVDAIAVFRQAKKSGRYFVIFMVFPEDDNPLFLEMAEIAKSFQEL